MKTAKQEVFDVLERLPDDVSMDTLLVQLHFRATVMRGLDDVRRGDVVSDEEVRERLKKWLESSGREKLSDT